MKKWFNKRARIKSLLNFPVNRKKGIVSEISVWWIIAIVAMVIIFVLMIDVQEALGSAIGFVKNQLRFGR